MEKMKKNIKLIVTVIIGFGLIGCGTTTKPTLEEKLCNDLDKIIEKYDQEKISFNDLAVEAEKISNNYCKEHDDKYICVIIRLIKHQSEYDYTLEDCSNQATSPINLKKLCETNNNLKKEMLEKKDSTEANYLNTLKYECEKTRKN